MQNLGLFVFVCDSLKELHSADLVFVYDSLDELHSADLVYPHTMNFTREFEVIKNLFLSSHSLYNRNLNSNMSFFVCKQKQSWN